MMFADSLYFTGLVLLSLFFLSLILVFDCHLSLLTTINVFSFYMVSKTTLFFINTALSLSYMSAEQPAHVISILKT